MLDAVTLRSSYVAIGRVHFFWRAATLLPYKENKLKAGTRAATRNVIIVRCFIGTPQAAWRKRKEADMILLKCL